jgi:hypothetical protein
MALQKRYRPTIAAALGLGFVLAACEAKETGVVEGEPNNPILVLKEGPCDGTCPVYDLTLHPDGSYMLNAEKFVKLPGFSEGSVGADSWALAEAVLNEVSFWTLKETQTAETLPNCQPGAPTVTITYRNQEGREKTLTYDAGCGVQKVRALVTSLRGIMGFDTLVWTDQQFDPTTGEPR